MIFMSNNLEVLSLQNCNLQDEGVIIISDGLKPNRSIHTLNLAENGISNLGGKAIIKVLKARTIVDMKCLNLKKNFL